MSNGASQIHSINHNTTDHSNAQPPVKTQQGELLQRMIPPTLLDRAGRRNRRRQVRETPECNEIPDIHTLRRSFSIMFVQDAAKEGDLW
ncbi:hypothetical protein E2C01_069290 [Portunus trituberculatus]|uniref:Uncharacterized protein n=1 Tax=Portunus trituberculatus TaxID=210409 RepID=A0A5B7HPP1_PORTR|nr:hypothetical protein [Portunus trituberculatus]